MSKKGETKRALKEKVWGFVFFSPLQSMLALRRSLSSFSSQLSSRPEQAVLEQRGILVRSSNAETPSGKGSRKGPSSRRERRSDSISGMDKLEKRKSSVFGRSKSTKLSMESVNQVMCYSVIGRSVPEAAEIDCQPVPRLVQHCIDRLWSIGFEEPGLFRVSGDKTLMDRVVEAFDRNDMSLLDEADVHIVSSLLKLFFRMGSQPLFTVESHAQLLAACGTPDAIARYGELLSNLPRPNRETVQVLLPLLRGVANRNEVNLMTPANLGIVFGPTLMRSAAELAGEIDMTNRSAYTVEYLVTHWEAISILLPLASGLERTSLDRKSSSSPVTVSSPPLTPSPSLPPPPARATPGPPSSSSPALRGGGGTPLPPRPVSLSIPDVSRLPPPGALPPPVAAALPRPPNLAVLPPPPMAAGSPFAPRRAPPGVPAAAQVSALPPGARASKALYDFTGDKSKGQIDLKKGAALIVLQDHAAGWSTVDMDGVKGFVPSTYVAQSK